MKRIVKWHCDYCGELFDRKQNCEAHEQRHEVVYKANKMLKDGKTLQQIQDECSLWEKVPSYLRDVTTENAFIVSWWQCCDKPAYRIERIDFSGLLYLYGCGSWTGYYGGHVRLRDSVLKLPFPKEELFVDERYH